MRSGLVLAGLLALAAVPAAQSPPSADELAKRLQTRYESVRSFTADFTQTYSGGVLRLSSAERGVLKLRKPSRFRMEYTSPSRKTFVADGTMFYSYFPEDKTGSRARLPQDDQVSTALLFIAGRGNLVRDFTASLPADQPPDEWRLSLVPKTPDADFETLTLSVDRRSFALVAFAWTDADGGTTTTRLSNLRENTSLPDSEFAFRFPPGVHLIER